MARASATLALVVATLLITGCGGGGSDETVTFEGGATISVEKYADSIAASPELQSICESIDKKGFAGALADFEKTYKFSPFKEKVPAVDLFTAIANHC